MRVEELGRPESFSWSFAGLDVDMLRVEFGSSKSISSSKADFGGPDRDPSLCGRRREVWTEGFDGVTRGSEIGSTSRGASVDISMAGDPDEDLDSRRQWGADISVSSLMCEFWASRAASDHVGGGVIDRKGELSFRRDEWGDKGWLGSETAMVQIDDCLCLQISSGSTTPSPSPTKIFG